jgi:5'-phosphate synthase pdxT subunit
MTNTAPTVGVLALQGDVREHLRVLDGLGVRAILVRRPAEISVIDGIVIPGGESTTMSRLLDTFELREPLQARLRDGLPAFGSCAGMIMLATRILDGRPDQRPLGAIDITVRRNAFGRQVDSFETELQVQGMAGPPLPAVFIRAPWVERVGDDVQVLAAVPAALTRGEPPGGDDGHLPPEFRPVAVRQHNAMATSFHPEVTADHRMHELFLSIVRSA